MEELVSQVTLPQFFGWLLALFAAMAAADKAADVYRKWRGKSPGAQHDGRQDARLDDHEMRIGTLESKAIRLEAHLAKDMERLDRLEEANRAIARSLLALLNHAMGCDDGDALGEAKKELETYLINK